MVDLNQALLDPTSVFARPKDVLANKELSREHKIDILRRWAYDAKELQTASDESMTSIHPTEHLEDILKCLHELGAGLVKD